MRAVPLSGQLVATLKAWKLKSQFSRSDDLIFPNRGGHHLGHDNLVKRHFLPLFDLLPTVRRFNWHGFRHFAVHAGSKQGLCQRRYRLSLDSIAASHDGPIRHLFPSDDHRKAMDQIAKGLF